MEVKAPHASSDSYPQSITPAQTKSDLLDLMDLFNSIHKAVNQLCYSVTKFTKEGASDNQKAELFIQRTTVIEALNRLEAILASDLDMNDAEAGLYALELRHVRLHLAKMYDLQGEIEDANRLLLSLFAQHKVDGSLDERGTSKLIVFLLRAKAVAEYRQRISEVVDVWSSTMPNAASKARYVIKACSDVEEAILMLPCIEAALPFSGPPDTQELQNAVNKLINGFEVSPPFYKRLIGGLVIQAYKKIKIYRGKTSKKAEKADTSVHLTRAYARLIQCLLRRTGVDVDRRFWDLYDLYDCLRLQPSLRHEFEPPSLKDILIECRSIGKRLLENKTFINSLNLGLKSFFLSCLGEVCRAHHQLECVKGEENRVVLEEGKEYLTQAFHLYDPPKREHYNFNYPRIGYCYFHLGFYEEAISCYMKVINPDEQSKIDRATSWNAQVRIAQCYQELGVEAFEEGREQAAKDFWAMAEEWYLKAHAFNNVPTIPPWETEDDYLLGLLANFYFLTNQIEKAVPYYHAIDLRAIDADSSDKNLYDCYSYRHALALMNLGRNEKAWEQFERTLAREPEQRFAIKSYLSMRSLAILMGDPTRIQRTQDRIMQAGLVGVEIDGLKLDHLDILLDEIKMRNYVYEMKARLERRECWSCRRELSHVIKECERLKDKDDKVLHTLIARADMGVGNYESALKTLSDVLTMDFTRRNAAITWFYIGDCYMGLNRPTEASDAYLRSYNIGQKITALVKAASAKRLVGDYQQAIVLLEKVLSSGKDEKPHQTCTMLARTYWSWYSDKTPGVGRDESNVEKATAELHQIILDPSAAGDWQAGALLAEMAGHARSHPVVLDLIKQGNNIAIKNLLSSLASYDAFDLNFLHAAIDRWIVEAADRGDAFKTIADFIVKGLTWSYYNSDRNETHARVEYLVNAVFFADPIYRQSLFVEILGSSRGAHRYQLDKKIIRRIKELIPEKINDAASHVENVLQNIHPKVLEWLRRPYDLVEPNVKKRSDFIPSPHWKRDLGLDSTTGKVDVENCKLVVRRKLRNEPETNGGRIEVAMYRMPTTDPGWCAWQEAVDLIESFWPCFGMDLESQPLWYKEILSESPGWSAKITLTDEGPGVAILFSVNFTRNDFGIFLLLRKAFTIHREMTEISKKGHIVSLTWDLSQILKGKITAKIVIPGPIVSDEQHFWNFLYDTYEKALTTGQPIDGFWDDLQKRFSSTMLELNAEEWVKRIIMHLEQMDAITAWYLASNNSIHRVLHDSKKFGDKVEGAADKKIASEEAKKYLNALKRIDVALAKDRRDKMRALGDIETRYEFQLIDLVERALQECCIPGVLVVKNFGEGGSVLAESELLKRGFSDLLHNAFQAAANVIEPDRKKVYVGIYTSEDVVSVEIVNSYNDEASSSQGTGYGISDAQEIVQDHQGRLVGPEMDLPEIGYCKTTVILPAVEYSMLNSKKG